MRSLISGLKGEDYILMAEAKGLSDQRILWGYAFRNALLPQATGLALSLGSVVGGALITEVIFAYQGIGWLIYQSIRSLDYPVIQGSVLLVIILGGALVGFISGYFGGAVDSGSRILIDVFLAVPSLLFLILIASLVRGVRLQTIALVIGAFSWAWPARQVRAQVLSLKERPFVQVARLSGMSGLEIIFRELMPHMFQWLGANFVNAFLVAVLAESALSILGLGSQRDMTLGMMIYWALSYGAILQNLWWWLTPVLALTFLFLALYLMHMGFDEVSNPRLRAQA